MQQRNMVIKGYFEQKMLMAIIQNLQLMPSFINKNERTVHFVSLLQDQNFFTEKLKLLVHHLKDTMIILHKKEPY